MFKEYTRNFMLRYTPDYMVFWNNCCFLFAHRYLKSVFPTVEEYLLLDVLTNNDNNVQKAADKLVKMGYVKRDTPSK